MRSRNNLATQAPARRTRFYRAAGLAALLLALVAPISMTGVRPTGAQSRITATTVRGTTAVRGAAATTKQDAGASAQPVGTRITPASVTKVSFRQLAEREARDALTRSKKVKSTPVLRAIHPPLSPPEVDTPGAPVASDDTVAPAQNDTGGPLVPSPTPATTYLAQEDGPKVQPTPATVFVIPPDTQGAVGLDKVFVNTNSNYRVQNKATGAPLSTVSSDLFWASSGGTGFFDPRIVFDPYQQRWILAMDSDSSSVNSSIEIAVSQTSDPSGSYNIYRFVVGCVAATAGCVATGTGEWADFPMLGFNKNMVVVGMNMFRISDNASVEGRTLVLDYAQLRAGAPSPTGTLFAGAAIGTCNHPAETYDPNEATMYLVKHLSSGGATYALSTITGTAAAPTFTIGATLTRPGGGWTQPGGDILPQTCVGVAGVTCPTTLRRIDTTDAFVRGDVVFRNGNIYYPQIIVLPAGGTITLSSHVSVQWTKLDTAGNVVDGGRIDDPAATIGGTGEHYAYPSIAVNKNNDMLIGFTQYSTTHFANAGYAVRLNGDAAGTTRDPVVYKAGEDYYSKAFSGTRNRWGDYSATRIDPVNDRDMWTIQEYAGTRTVPDANTTTNNSRWGTFWAKVALPAVPGELDISEFREHGTQGATDEFIEIYNNTDAPHTVATADGSAGYAVVSSSNTTLNDGSPTVRCTIPTGTTIPARGHYLCVNSVGYSLSSYPAGNGTTATGDATYTSDIPVNSGLAIFNTANAANFSLTTRLDAVGATTESNTLYKEGTGYPAITLANPSLNMSFVRDMCGKGGSLTQLGGCPQLGFAKDTNNNSVDFFFVDTQGTSAGAGQRLGAPGPENLSSPVLRNSPQFLGPNLDQTVGASSPPNRVRDPTPDGTNNSPFGTLDIRKRIVNNTANSVTRLRFRIIDITTFPSASTPGFADLRARTSTAVIVSGVNDPATCPGGITPCTVTVQGTTLEEALSPNDQPNDGGFNSSLSADTVTLATPIPPGGSINVRFLLGIQTTGTFKFLINVEALP